VKAVHTGGRAGDEPMKTRPLTISRTEERDHRGEKQIEAGHWKKEGTLEEIHHQNAACRMVKKKRNA